MPASLANLTDRQARALDHASWHGQVDALVADIERHYEIDRPAHSTEPAKAILGQYAKAQLRRVDTILRTNGLTPGGGRWSSVEPATELVVPDLLPFQVELPATDRLTAEVAAHLRRAVKDRARYSSKAMLSGAIPQRIVIVGGPGSGKTTLLGMMARAAAVASIADAAAKTPVLLRVRDLPVSSGDSLTSEIMRDAGRTAGAIQTLVQCAETTLDWRRSTAHRLVDVLAQLLVEEPTDEAMDDAETGMQALGWLRVSSPETRELCLQFLRHKSERMRMAATYGIGGLPADAQVCSEIAMMLDTPEAVGRLRGGLVDALHRVLSSD